MSGHQKKDFVYEFVRCKLDRTWGGARRVYLEFQLSILQKFDSPSDIRWSTPRNGPSDNRSSAYRHTWTEMNISEREQEDRSVRRVDIFLRCDMQC